MIFHRKNAVKICEELNRLRYQGGGTGTKAEKRPSTLQRFALLRGNLVPSYFNS
jgi:hypothetical protein